MFKKYYPFDPKVQQQIGPALRYNSTSYEGDSLSIYADPAHTSIYSQEDIYLVLNKFNPKNGLVPIECAYSEQRQSPILSYKSSQYKICLASVHIPENSIELFDWEDTVRFNDGSVIPKYSISVEYRNGGFPVAVSDVPLIFTPYYETDAINNQRVYSIDQCLQSLNTAFKTAYTNLGVLSKPSNTLAQPPNFYIDHKTGLIKFLFDYSSQTGGILTEPDPTKFVSYAGESFVRLSFNFNVYSWFYDSFPNVIPVGLIGSNTPPLANEPIYSYLKTYQRLEPDYDITISGRNWWNISQTHVSSALFSNVVRILITSNINTRPIYTSYLDENQVLSTNNPSSMNSINILGDFPIESLSTSNSLVFDGHPTGHQWKDILTTEPLRTLSYNILCLRSDGSVTPVLLNPGKMATVKLIFSLK